jgi:lysophospholipase L1-like esterase
MRRYSLFLPLLAAITLIFLAACDRTPQLPPLAADATILAFGDSLTFGTGAGETESYPAVLERLVGRRVVNAGIPGELSAAGAQRLPELLDREKPALLILCHGGNDLLTHQSPQSIAGNLRAMIRQARERGVAVVLLAVPAPDLSLAPPPLYADLAKEFDIPVEGKALRHILGKRGLKSDPIHPNAAGYRQLAEAATELLHKSGALPDR